jgi:2-polyprenyl-6-hydroxyphenyl methylase/3-demethylubiquinone-9 3-methyltransferase
MVGLGGAAWTALAEAPPMKSSNKKLTEEPSSAPVSAPESAEAARANWDHSTHDSFYDYYAKESQTEKAQQRFQGVRDTILRVMANEDRTCRILDVADIGCGAGTQSLIWAELGHRVHAVDVNEPLVDLGRERATRAGFAIDFRVGSATALPWPDESVDVCVALELLEHVAEWHICLSEFVRILRPGGALFVTTTNQLCPMQAEFNLPLYSWYPRPMKHHYEKLAVTTRPDIANFARYPAVNWFTYYGLRKVLSQSGFRCLDRFDMIDLDAKGAAARTIVKATRSVAPLRCLGHVCTRGTRILAIKGADTKRSSTSS